jgi:transposase InsO family protein
MASAQTESNQNYRLQQEAHASIQSASIVSKKRGVSSDLLHRRLGHRTVNAIMSGSRNEVWADTTMQWEHDDFCNSCQGVTARLSSRGKSPLDVGHEEMAPGEYIMCDVVPNMSKRDLTASSHYKCYLLVTDVKSRFTVPIGIISPSSRNIADALLVWSRDYGPDVTFILHDVLKLRADAAQAHFAAELTELLTEHRIKGTFAAPCHQNQNGTCVRAWQSIREIAFKMMVHAHVPDEFYDFALEHAWKIFNCLPIRDLQLDGKPCTPLGSYTGNKPHLARFRVLFCP